MIEDTMTICVIGCGSMGWQIALHCAVHGHSVSMTDVSAAACSRARALQVSELERRVGVGTMDRSAAEATLARLHVVEDLTAAATGADIAIEIVLVKSSDFFRNHFPLLAHLASARFGSRSLVPLGVFCFTPSQG